MWIVEKNVNGSRDFRLYLWSAVNVQKTVEYTVRCRVIVVYADITITHIILHRLSLTAVEHDKKQLKIFMC